VNADLSVRIDGCQGHGRCFDICPDVFEPDVEGYAQVREGSLTAEVEVRVLEAEAACPEHAIAATG
jgi:ferredoxin